MCVHASLRSLGWLEGGASTIIHALLQEGCTVLGATHSSVFGVPPFDQRPARNGWDYAGFAGPTLGITRVYHPATNDVNATVGAFSAALVAWPGRLRGNHPHPLGSFSAVGPLAHTLIAPQGPLDIYAPLRELAEEEGAVVLMGVGLQRMTLVHLAERIAGRQLFRRWANGPDGHPITVEAGGCSEGFGKLAPFVAHLMRESRVGQSHWQVFPAAETLHVLVQAIQSNPMVTHCGDQYCERCNDAVLPAHSLRTCRISGDQHCERCNDAVAGGPIL